MLAKFEQYTYPLRFGNMAGLPVMFWAIAVLVGLGVGLTVLIDVRLAPIIALGILVVPLLFLKPMLMCYALILSIVLVSGVERGRFIPLLALSEVVLIGCLGITAVIVLTKTHQSSQANSYYGFAAAIFLLGGLTFLPIAIYRLTNVNLNTSNAFRLAAYVQYFMLFFIFYKIPNKKADVRQIIYLMLFGGFLMSVFGLLQATGWGVITNFLRQFYASSHTEASLDGGGRITSLLGAWNALGMFLSTCIILGWSILPYTKSQIAHIGTIIAIATCFLCLLASGSFAGIMGVIIGIVVVEWFGQRGTYILPYLFALIIVTILAFIIFQSILIPLLENRLLYQFRHGGILPQTFEQRLLLWDEIFIPAIRRTFPLPVYPVVPHTFLWRAEESQYLTLLFRTGLAGFASFIGWLIMTFGWLNFKLHHTVELERALVVFALATLIMLTISGLTNAVFTYSGTSDYLWIVLALIAAGMTNRTDPDNSDGARMAGKLV